jgi:secreted trypsin-like serine protease
MYKALVLLVGVAVAIDARSVQSAGAGFKDPVIPTTYYRDDRIVGGEEVVPGQFPYQVALFESYLGIKYFTCGASLISQNIVLTAAHCVIGVKAQNLFLRVGEHHLDVSSGNEQELPALSITRHEAFNELTNDVAVIRVNGTFVLNDFVKTIGLPPQGEEYTGGNCVVSGWGSTRDGGAASRVLRHVSVPFVDDATCNDNYGGGIISSMLCAGGVGGKDACQGDSGGPIVCDGGNGTVSGIVSWGNGCARPGYPGVYTQTSAFTDWIRNQAGLAF